MEPVANYKLPNRITDLVAFKEQGFEVVCNPIFEILPVDFAHRDNIYQAFVFLCRFKGRINEQDYMFRKCYARGCPHNLCPHVSQAVMIANRYLQRDYKKLTDVGVQVEKRLFTLEDMVVKFDEMKEEHSPLLVIHDYIDIAKGGSEVAVEMALEFVTGVEHFANYKNQQVFLMVSFSITTLGKTHPYERCLACYEADKEKQERAQKIDIANERLKILYNEFDQVSIKYKKRFFDSVKFEQLGPQ
jgi:hypothetical protein